MSRGAAAPCNPAPSTKHLPEREPLQDLQAKPETGRGWLGPIGAARGRGVPAGVWPRAVTCRTGQPPGRARARAPGSVRRGSSREGGATGGAGRLLVAPGGRGDSGCGAGRPGVRGVAAGASGRAGARGGVGEFLACRRVAGVPGWCSGSPGSGRGGGTWASRSGCGDGGPAGSWLRDGARGWGLLGGRKVREVAERGGVCGHGPGARVCARAAGTCLVLSRGSRDSRASVVTFQFL